VEDAEPVPLIAASKPTLRGAVTGIASDVQG
jgi:hypothetical protein